MDSLKVYDFVQQYQGNFQFLIDLKQKLNKYGKLTGGQLHAAHKCMMRQQEWANQPKKTFTYTYNPGDRLEIKAWLARTLASQLGMDVFLRNIEVVEVERETRKAVLATVRFVSSVACSCHVCGRALDTEVSRATGIGPVCADKIGVARPKKENAKEVLAQIEEYARNIGSIGPIWIAKSQIKQVLEEEQAA